MPMIKLFKFHVKLKLERRQTLAFHLRDHFHGHSRDLGPGPVFEGMVVQVFLGQDQANAKQMGLGPVRRNLDLILGDSGDVLEGEDDCRQRDGAGRDFEDLMNALENLRGVLGNVMGHLKNLRSPGIAQSAKACFRRLRV